MNQPLRTILIVDDSPEDRELYRRCLQPQSFSLEDSPADSETYRILEADLGSRGLDLWEQHQPDAMLLDYRLPDLDGVEFLRRLYPTPQHPLPIIVVTGQGNEAIAVEAMKAGAQDYLVKGQITPERLQLAIQGAISKVQIQVQLQQRIERERLIADITRKIHQSLDLKEILQTTVDEVMQFLQADRVFMYQFQPDFDGVIAVESVRDPWPSILHARVEDQYFVETQGEDYRQGRIQATDDIYTGGLTGCHIELLENFKIRANLVVPILQGRTLWGLLVTNQCAGPRPWQQSEIELLQQLTTQVGIALQQAELYQQTQDELRERRRIETELRNNEQLLRLALTSAHAGSWDWEIAKGRVIWSAENYDLYGIDPDRGPLQYDDWYNSLHPEDRESVHAAVMQTVEQGLPEFRYDFRILHPQRGVRWLLGMGRLTVDDGGNPVRLSGINLDITDRKQAEAQRERLLQREQTAREEAERANRIKDEFLAVLSHELRSPLNPILGWSKLLQTQKLDAVKTAQALSTIERNVKLQTQLIDDLLDVARILRGKLKLDEQPVNLSTTIAAAMETVSTAAAAKSIRLHFTEVSALPGDAAIEDVATVDVPRPEIIVSGDPARLQQIVWNLLSNAIKFTPTGGQVEIRLGRVDGQAGIAVQDTGKGINSDFLPHLFEAFRQEDSSITRHFGGLGLGLSIVRYLVEAHGGTITANSPGEGQGATFTVSLPLLWTDTEMTNLPASAPDTVDLTDVKILAVDDDRDTLEILDVLLSYYGATVLTETSAAAALNTLESALPDLIISDLGMPEMDGYALLRQIRRLAPDKGGRVPAIALTAYARGDDQQRALDSGFQRHIAKPIETDQLVQAVASLIRS